MPKRSLLPDPVEAYVFDLITRETPIQRRLRQATASLPNANMQIGPDQAAFFDLLIRATGARRALEIGTFTGYSALAVASALPPDGLLVCCDISDEWTSIGRPFWRQAGVESKIDLRLGPALDTLRALLADGAASSFDFAFIDADKSSYPAYYELCLSLVRPGGLIALDNMLRHGAVTDPSDTEPETETIRSLNLFLRDDPRVDSCLLTLGDGVALVRRRAPAPA